MRKQAIFGLMAALLGLVISCNKTPMRGEYERFVGTWRWENTSWFSGGSQLVVMEANSQPYLYTIKITKQGEMYWYKDGEQLQQLDLKVDKSESGCSESNCTCYILMKHPTLFTNFGYSCSLGYDQLEFPDSGFPYDAPGIPEDNRFIRIE